MKTLKKLFSVSAIVALLGTLAPMYAFGAGNSLDLDPEFPQAYAYAYANGITTQSEDNADMGGKLTRIALAKMIAKYAINVLNLTPDTSKTCNFTDVTAALDAQYDNGVTQACQLGLMGVNITAFRPNDLVTRGEFGTTFSRALNANSDNLAAMNAADPYYKEHLNYLNKEGIMKVIDPNMLEVRGYVMLMMMRSDENYTPAAEGCSAEELLACFNADDYDACIAACSDEEEPETPTGDGFVTVKRVGSTTTTEVAQNAVNKKVGSIKLTAGDYDTTVNSIVIAHSGLGTAKDVKVQLYMNGVSVSSAKSITKASAEATLKLSPVLTIKAGKSETIDVMVSLGTGAGSNETHSFSVSAVNVADGKAEGTPVSLDSIRTTSYKVAEGKIGLKAGSASLEAGDTNKKIVSVTFNPEKNANLSSVVITKKDGSADLNLDEVFGNVKAYYDNKEVGNVSIEEDTIKLSNLNIETNKNITIDLKGDCIYVGKSGNITFDFDVTETGEVVTDVLATEVSTSENMRVYNNPITNVTVKIEGIDMSLKNLTTKAQNVAAGKTDIELMNLELSTATDFELSQFTVLYDETNTGLENVYLYIDGSEYDELAASGHIYKDDTFSVTAKKPLNIKVIGDFKDDATGSYQFEFVVKQIKNDNGDKVAISKVSKKGHTTTVKAAGITAKKTANIPSSKTIKEGEEATLLYFDLKANNDDVIVESLAIDFSGVSVNVLSGYTDELVLMQGNREVDTIDLTELTGTLTTGAFENVNYTVAEGDTVSFTVRANIKDGDVTKIGDKIKLSLLSYNGVPGTEYTITSELPDVILSNRNAEYTTITFENTSAYDDIYVTSFTVKVAPVIANLPKNMETFAATLRLLDGVNGNDIWGTSLVPTSGNVPGTVVVNLTTPLKSGEDAYIQLDNVAGLESNWYTIEVTSVSFKYYDEDDGVHPTTAITENYSEKL